MAKHRAKSQTPERRREIAKRAIAKRWAQYNASKTSGNGPPGPV